MLVGSAGGGFLCCYATTANSVLKKVLFFFLVKAEKLRSRLKKWMQISMLPVRTRAFVPLGRLFFNS